MFDPTNPFFLSQPLLYQSPTRSLTLNSTCDAIGCPTAYVTPWRQQHRFKLQPHTKQPPSTTKQRTNPLPPDLLTQRTTNGSAPSHRFSSAFFTAVVARDRRLSVTGLIDEERHAVRAVNCTSERLGDVLLQDGYSLVPEIACQPGAYLLRQPGQRRQSRGVHVDVSGNEGLFLVNSLYTKIIGFQFHNNFLFKKMQGTYTLSSNDHSSTNLNTTMIFLVIFKNLFKINEMYSRSQLSTLHCLKQNNHNLECTLNVAILCCQIGSTIYRLEN